MNTLGKNFPHPYIPITRIQYEIGEPGQIRSVIQNVFGRAHAVLTTEHHSQGIYSAEFTGARLPCRVYFVFVLKSQHLLHIEKILLIK